MNGRYLGYEKVRPRLHNAIAASLLIISIGGHWAVLQSIAWVGMFAKFSQQDTFSVAVEKTFNGKHPCKLCKAVDQGRKCEQKKVALKSDIQIAWILVEDNEHLWSPDVAAPFISFNQTERLSLIPPPTPPPRLA